MTHFTKRYRAVFLATTVTACALIALACGDRSKASPSSPSSVTSSARPSTTPAGLVPGSAEGAGPLSLAYPAENDSPNSPSVIGFPPRNEPNLFFSNLQALYRDFLRRPQSAPSFVDPEGENVWLTEYFRFYLNGCTHDTAVSRTLQEITTGASLPTCGFETPVFPPRNLPNAFQTQLEATYRDVLRRPQLLQFIDSEGANVWLAEYLRYRISGCDHATAEARVFNQIRGSGIAPDCSGFPSPSPSPVPAPSPTPTPSPSPGGGTSVTDTVAPLGTNRHPVTISGTGQGTMTLTLDWSDPGVDLDLYLTTQTCNAYPPTSCTILNASQANSGTSERITRSVRGGDTFYAWVDSFTNRSQTYTLSLALSAVAPTGGNIQLTLDGAQIMDSRKPARYTKGN